ncbi:MAG: 4Fe-4S binding protein [Chloroflexi bacterium]|nr:4Fe-4S binding protein [Chloroflexota bacterium]
MTETVTTIRETPLEKRGSVEIDAERCKGCGLCVMTCGRRVLAMSQRLNSKGYNPAEVVQPERCTGCALCALMCPDVAIRVSRSGKPRVFDRQREERGGNGK